MTVIEISPHKWGWRVFEAPGVEPVLRQKDQAIGYAETRACFWTGENSRPGFDLASSNAPSRSTRQIECCDCRGLEEQYTIRTS
jgi:hypothetical protein